MKALRRALTGLAGRNENPLTTGRTGAPAPGAGLRAGAILVLAGGLLAPTAASSLPGPGPFPVAGGCVPAEVCIHGGTSCVDSDGDGWCDDVDCDDEDADITPATVCFEGGSSCVEADGDGWCDDVDCNDSDVEITPATVCFEGGSSCVEADGDGWCDDVDCDDNDVEITPATVCYEGGSSCVDADGDGWCGDADCDDFDPKAPAGVCIFGGSSCVDGDGDGWCDDADCDDSDDAKSTLDVCGVCGGTATECPIFENDFDDGVCHWSASEPPSFCE